MRAFDRGADGIEHCMASDDSTWIIHSLPALRGERPVPVADQAAHAFRSVLSPWRSPEPAHRGPVAREPAESDGPTLAAG
jgi:hypothetical protein